MSETQPTTPTPDPYAFPVADEYCDHVNAGAPVVGGVFFQAHVPPITVGMCERCVEWCRTHLDNPTPWSQVAAELKAADDEIIDAEYIDL